MITKNKTIICSAAMFAAVFLFNTASARNEHHDDGAFSNVVSPEVPRYVDFADQKIDLNRTDMYERLDRELSSMCYTHGNTLLVLKRANRYFPQIVPILKKNGVPEDLAYLACIESTLNPRALSGVKAAGMWQFMESSGRQYGLEVNDYVDERYDVEKATEAACKYLKDAYAKYGNWESAAASYNGGMGRISNELSSQQQSSAYDLYLNDETSRYIYRLISMKLIMEHPDKYGYKLKKKDLYFPIRTTDVVVDTPVDDWVEWVKSYDISYLQLRDFNPWIRAKSLPNKTGKAYVVKIPNQDDLYRTTQQKPVYNKNWTID